ncbi:MAG: peptide chain release factor N(5)-glutamine methyltransferase [Burkholderiaceae bacterium]|nr:MAG: peptide chain release factor N(5)-glutamine methyltransferase [Burkholderiaceae bacterium]
MNETNLPTIAQLLQACTLPALETRMLLCHVTGLSREQLITRREHRPSAEQVAVFLHLGHQRLHGRPMAYLLGTREFYGRPFRVNEQVLIPRPETELLVETVLDCLHGQEAPAVLDLGTGSGAIAVTLALEAPHANVSASDVSPAALAVARGNAAQLEAAVTFIESDWWQALPPQRFDVIVSNPPYIAASDPHLQQGDLRFEPPQALTDNADGLSAYREIIAQAGGYLQAGGWLWLEHGYDQADAVCALLEQAEFGRIGSKCDLAGHARVSGGQML